MLVSVIGNNVFSQECVVTGKVLDEQSKEPIEFAYVSLLEKDVPSYTKHTFTNNTGDFSLNIKKGTYILLITQFGKELFRTSIEVKEDINLNNIGVNNIIELEGVTVQAIRRITKESIGKTTVDVKNKKIFEGDNAVSILSKIQGVLVMDNRILYDGIAISSVRVNNRKINFGSQEEMLNFLKGVGNTSIENIEIINSSAKNSASNTGNILNLNISKKAFDGVSFTPTLKYSQGKVADKSLSIFSQLKKGKLSSNIYFNYGKEKNFIDKKYTTYYTDINKRQNQQDEIFSNIKPLNIDVGVQYDFSSKTFIGAAIKYDNMVFESNSESEITPEETKNNNIIHNINNSKITNNSYTASLYFGYAIDSLSKIRFEMNHNYYNTIKKQFLVTKKENHEITNKLEQKTDRITTTPNISLDYQRKIFKKIDFLMGLLYHKMNNSENRLTLQNNQIISENNFDENVFAQYVSLSGKNKYFSYQVGLRGEYTNNPYQKYYDLFPSMSLRKNISKNTNLQISYNKFIGRPMGYMLSPNLYYLNPYLAKVGNPNILPTKTDKVSLVLSYNKWRLSSSYSKLKNGIGVIPFIENSNEELIIDKYTNILSQDFFNVNISYSYYNKNLRVTPTLYYFFNNFRLNKKDEKRNDYFTFFNLTSSFNINKTNRIDANFNYTFTTKEIFTKKEPFFSFDIFYNKKFHNGINLRIFVKDLFKGKVEESTRIFNAAQITGTTYRDSRQIGIEFRYTFNSGDKIQMDGRKNNVDRK